MLCQGFTLLKLTRRHPLFRLDHEHIHPKHGGVASLGESTPLWRCAGVHPWHFQLYCARPNSRPPATTTEDGTDCRGLSRTEEYELANRIASGDSQALNRLVQANLGLVVVVARAFQGRGLPLDDLIGEGNLGLIRAAKDYDPRYGTRFGTYAGYWIKNAILHSLMNTKSTIRLPVHIEKLLIKWRKARSVLCHQLNRSPLFEEVASHLGLSQAQRSLVRKAQLAVRVQTESNLTGEDVRNPLVEVSDPRGDDEKSLEAREEQWALECRLKTLDHREHAILAAPLRSGRRGTHPSRGGPSAGDLFGVGPANRGPRHHQVETARCGASNK